MNSRVSVCVRFRGGLGNQDPRWKIEENTVTCDNANNQILNNGPNYVFDRVFLPKDTTYDIFGWNVKEIVRRCLLGYNATVFAYGQTASGKTFTMHGDGKSNGIIPYAINELFASLEEGPGVKEGPVSNAVIHGPGGTSSLTTASGTSSSSSTGVGGDGSAEFVRFDENDKMNRSYLITVSYLEIYNEQIRDLLQVPGPNQPLSNQPIRLFDNPHNGTLDIRGLSETRIENINDVFDCLQRGEKQRHFGETRMNDRSSRSHTILRICLESRGGDPAGSSSAEDGKQDGKQEKAGEGTQSSTANPPNGSNGSAGKVFQSVLHLVDLAGSEGLRRTNAEGQRRVEGGNINKSLLSLSKVINQLVEKQQHESSDSSHNAHGATHGPHIAFRESILTRILQTSLGGNAMTVIIAAVAGDSANYHETKSTLEFANRAKCIKNSVKKNVYETESNQLKRALKEISDLKKKIAELSNKGVMSAQVRNSIVGGRIPDINRSSNAFLNNSRDTAETKLAQMTAAIPKILLTPAKHLTKTPIRNSHDSSNGGGMVGTMGAAGGGGTPVGKMGDLLAQGGQQQAVQNQVPNRRHTVATSNNEVTTSSPFRGLLGLGKAGLSKIWGNSTGQDAMEVGGQKGGRSSSSSASSASSNCAVGEPFSTKNISGSSAAGASAVPAVKKADAATAITPQHVDVEMRDESEIDSLRSQLQHAQENIDKLRKEARESSTRITWLSKVNKNLELSGSELETKNDNQRQQIFDLNREMSERDSTIQSLKLKMQEQGEVQRLLREQNSSLSSTNTGLKLEKSQRTRLENIMMGTSISGGSSSSSSTGLNLANARAKLRKCEDRDGNIVAQNAGENDKIEEMNDAPGDLNQEMENALQMLSEENQNLQVKLSKAEKTAGEMASKLQETSQSQDSLNAGVADLRKKNEFLKNEIAVKNQELIEREKEFIKKEHALQESLQEKARDYAEKEIIAGQILDEEKENVERLEKNLEEVRANVTTLETTLKEAETALKEAESDMEYGRNLVVEKDKLVVEKDRLLETKDTEITQLKGALQDMEGSGMKLLETKDAKIAEQTTLLQQKDTQLEEQKQLITAKDSQLADKEKEIDSVMNETESIVSDQQKTNEKKLAAKAEQITALQQQNNSLQEQNTSLQQQISELENKMDDQNANMVTLKSQKNQAGNEKTNLERELQQIKHQSNTFAKEIEGLNATIESRTAELKTTQDNLEQMQSDMDDRSRSVAELEANNANLVKELNNSKQHLAQSQLEKSSLQQELLVEQTSNRETVLTNQKESMKSEFDGVLKTELDRLKQNMQNEKEFALASMQQTYERNIEEGKAMLDKEHEDEKSRITNDFESKFKTQKQDSDKIISQMTEELQELTKVSSNLNKELDSAKENNKVLESENAEYERIAKTFEQQLLNTKNQRDEVMSEIVTRNAEISTLTGNLTLKSKEAENLMFENVKQKAELSNLQNSKVPTLEKNLELQKSNIRNLEQEIDKLNAEKRDKEWKALQSSSVEKNDMILELEHKLMEADEAKDKFESELRSALMKLDDLRLLKKQNTEMEANLKSAQLSLVDANNEKVVMEKELQRIQKEHAKQIAELSRKEAMKSPRTMAKLEILERMEKRLEEEKESYKKVEREKNDLEKEVRGLEKMNTTFKQALSEQRQTIEDLQHRCSNLSMGLRPSAGLGSNAGTSGESGAATSSSPLNVPGFGDNDLNGTLDYSIDYTGYQKLLREQKQELERERKQRLQIEDQLEKRDEELQDLNAELKKKNLELDITRKNTGSHASSSSSSTTAYGEPDEFGNLRIPKVDWENKEKLLADKHLELERVKSRKDKLEKDIQAASSEVRQSAKRYEKMTVAETELKKVREERDSLKEALAKYTNDYNETTKNAVAQATNSMNQLKRRREDKSGEECKQQWKRDECRLRRFDARIRTFVVHYWGHWMVLQFCFFEL